jgi:hypothetical protein
MRDFRRVAYADLNSRQKENYNFQKASSILAEYGFTALRLSDDWNGADFIALHVDGSALKVQLKGRLSFDQKYAGKGIWVCFPASDGRSVYLYPHDEFFKEVSVLSPSLSRTRSWGEGGRYHFPKPAKHVAAALERYRLTLESAVPQAD